MSSAQHHSTKNPFRAGQGAMCVVDFSKVGRCLILGKDQTVPFPSSYPKYGEELVVDEVLEDMIRFGQYDGPLTYNWWVHNGFVPLQGMEESISELMRSDVAELEEV